MKRKSGLLWFVLLLSMSSCVSFEKFSMEVFKPSDFNLPPDMRKITLVSRNLKYENDTLQDYQAKNYRLAKNKIRFNADSLAINTLMDTLSAKLQAQTRFDSIRILPVNTFPEMRVKEIGPGKREWYKDISEKTGADGLILLDMFSCFYSQFNDHNYSPMANVVTSNIWSVYDARKQKIIDRYVQIDTIYWDGKDENERYSKLRIPEKKEAIGMAAGVIGQNYSKHLLPAWTMVYRDIMSGGKPEFKNAAELARKNNWDEASAIWQNFANSKNKRDKTIALYNLALASEMSGDVERAIQLTDQAAATSSGAFMGTENEAVRKYSVILYRRKLEINKLDAQHELR